MKIIIFIEIFSFIFLLISAFLNVQNEKNFYLSLYSAAVIIIPALYSLFPLLKEHFMNLNKKKNRLSDSTFTDRYEDVNDVLKKLSMTEHIIEIKGNSTQCGKTWLAKKICDSINHPKDAYNNNLKCPYHKAIYIDMEKKPESFIDTFFEDNYINQNTVLIFDHVLNLIPILSKQEIFHFQLIYISKKTNILSPFCHVINEFEIQDIEKLHSKIRKNYPNIDNISKNEIDILYNLTSGNIGKIAAMLSHQEHIRWIKDIANNQQTDYEKKLNEIEIDLYCGNYLEGNKKIIAFEKKYKNTMNQNNDLAFKYNFIKSDCEHLLNNYENAIAILSVLENSLFQFENNDYKVELKKAHYYKHLWKCNDAINILQSIHSKCFSSMVDEFGILLAKYFINDLYVPNSHNNSLKEFLNLYIRADNSTLNYTEESKLKLKRYKAFFDFYNTHPSNEEGIIKNIDKVISIYKAQNNRLLGNSYFIKGEIYRLYKKYELAEEYYKKTLLVTDDNNINSQVNIMRYYLFCIKKIKINQPVKVTSKEVILKNVKTKNIYCEILMRYINCIELNDPNSKDIYNWFDNRIMPIL